jgi:hypothetical protein
MQSYTNYDDGVVDGVVTELLSVDDEAAQI